MFPLISNIGRGFGPVEIAGGSGVAPAAPTLSVIDAGSGTVTATVTGTGIIRLYYRLPGGVWTAGSSRSGNGIITQSGLTPGNLYEFSAVATVDGLSSPWADICGLYLYAASLAKISNLEKWIIDKIKTDYPGLFKTVDHWRGQIADDGGPAAYMKHAPFAFVTYGHLRPRREGDYDLNKQIGFVVFVGQADDAAGVSRIGSAAKPGSLSLGDAVITSIDNQHPGAGFDCDRLYLVESQIVVNAARMSEIYYGFEAAWITPSTNR